MKKHLKAIISVAIALPIVLYATGLLAQLIININTWKQAGSNYRVSPGLPSLSLMMNLKALVDFPENLIAFAIIIVGLFIFFVFGLRIGWGSHGILDADRNLTVSGSGSYGTASFMSVKESEHCFEITTARRTSQDILGMTEDGKVLTLPPNTRLNSNLAVCGASGTGKSRSISRNLIFQAAKRGESIIVTDPKSELYESMSRYLRDQGYEVRVFNLVQMDHSDSWNCLGEVGNSELLAQTFADVVLQNTSGDQRDPFWYNDELNLLKALVLYVALELPPAQRNLGTVYDLLCNESERSLSVIMDSIRHEHTNKFTGEVLPPSPASAPFAIFKQSSETVRTSVIIGLGYLFIATKLKAVGYPMVVLAHLVIAIPVCLRTLLPEARRFPQHYIDAAHTLGASSWKCFWTVELPLLRGSLITGVAFAFAMSLGELNATLTLAGRTIRTLPMVMYQLIESYNYQGACALGTILILASLLVFWLDEQRRGKESLL